MRFFSLVSLFFILSTMLHAEYIRSIRIGSFPSQKDAEISLNEINIFLEEHKNIGILQEEQSFIFKARASGKFYVTLAEPFTHREVLQEVLDTLRLAYPDIYVTKLKKLPKEPESLDVEVVSIAKELTQVIQPKPKKIVVPVETSVEKIKPKEIKPQKLDKKAKPKLEVQKQKEEKNSYAYEIIIFILVLLFLVIIRYLIRYKKENETYINKELIQKEQLEQIREDNIAKDKLLSHVSHELRTPMTAIMGLTHLVLESDLSKLQSDYIHKIESSSQHLLNLINDILDVSKIKAGELKIERTEFNINDILEYVLSVNIPKAKKNSVVLGLDVSHEVPSKLIGDPLRVGQVLINLIGNAVKFTKNGEVTISVKKVSSFEEGIRLEFAVSDTGIGMTQTQVENIFNSYYQADESTSREFGGTGLGLSISKELVELMNGEIKVSSKKDVGTTFSFTVGLTLKDAQNQRQYRLPGTVQKSVSIG